MLYKAAGAGAFQKGNHRLKAEYSVRRGSLPPRTPQAPRLPYAGSGHDHHSPHKTCRHTGTGERLFILTGEADFILVVLLARRVLFRHIRVFFQRYLSQHPGLQFPTLQEYIRGLTELSAER